MSIKGLSLEKDLPELTYGSVWLVSGGDGDPHHLLPSALQALCTADAVIHDPGVAPQTLDLVKPPRYHEAAVPSRAIERSIKLAQDGWRVVYLVAGNAMDRALKCAASFAQHNIPLCIAPEADEPLIGETQIGFLLHKPPTVGRTETGALVVLIAVPPSIAAAEAERRQPPLSFSMSGLAG